MKVVRGKQLVEEAPDLSAARVVLDVGTGDGRAAYRLAREHPDWLVVGLDPAWQRMVETAVRSARKPARGGAENLLFVCASIEDAPPELHGVAHEVRVLMPWGRLLRGIVLGEPEICGGLRAVARPDATLEVAVGTSIWRDPVPLEIRDLPELTVPYAREVLADRLAAAGWRLTDADRVTGTAPPSSWARRLGSSDVEVFAHLRARAC